MRVPASRMVLLLTAGLFALSFFLVPVREWYSWDPDCQLSRASYRSAIDSVFDHDEKQEDWYADLLRSTTGEWTCQSDDWYPRYRWGWDRRRRSGGPYWLVEDRIEWLWMLAGQTLMLLLGGGLASWLVRRERGVRTENG